MKAHRKLFSVERMAKVLKVSRSGYYAWLSRPESGRKKERRYLDVLVKAAFKAKHARYGSLKISRELAAQGNPYSRSRVADSMRRQGLRSKVRRKFVVTTDTKHNLKASPNLLNREFKVDRPDKVWTSDITYLRSRAGWLYLVVFLDLYSRRIVGWCVSTSLEHETVLTALSGAVWQRRPEPGLMIHSDRGIQYCCDGFRQAIDRHQFVQSMSRKGNCWDNAVTESFFRSLKTEWLYHVDLKDLDHAQRELFEYIELFYNNQRLHATLDYVSPADFEAQQQHQKEA
jgi:transposase InsO family protein|tara:strand:- start:135 stop:992 length:858 start_codon:yes stop_codon:yes gene_type:complete